MWLLGVPLVPGLVWTPGHSPVSGSLSLLPKKVCFRGGLPPSPPRDIPACALLAMHVVVKPGALSWARALPSKAAAPC